MALSDFLKRFKSNSTPEDSEVVGRSYGSAGQSLFSGILQEDFNANFQFPTSIDRYDKMRRTDVTVQALIRAFKGPLLSGKHLVQPYDKSSEARETAEFVRVALFDELDGGYSQFIDQAFNFFWYGFIYFEKIFKIKDGMVYWDRFAARDPKAHYRWGRQSTNYKWVNGKPDGVTQQLYGLTDDIAGTNTESETQPEIPWGKLILFVNCFEGNNFEGISVLRPVYRNYYYKDLLYRIHGIASERFGAGTPFGKHPAGLSKQAQSKLDEMLKNLRTNEQAYMRHEDSIEIGILSPNGGIQAEILEGIKFHDRKMYDSILAGFLNLTSGEGGSNALSQDQSSFFLRGLQYMADVYTGQMNKAIKELVDMNFTTNMYPTLEVTEIGQTSLDETLNAISTAIDRGIVTITAEDEATAREILKLPSFTVEEIESMRSERASIERTESPKEDVPKEEPHNEDSETKASEVKLASKKKRPSPREKEFVKNITEFEKFLGDIYKNKFIPILEKAEGDYRKVMRKAYLQADTKMVNSVRVLDNNPNNRKIEREALKAIDEITKRLESKLIKSPLERRLFNTTERMARKTIKSNKKKLSTGSNRKGYWSNVKALLFNDPRRMKENLVLNFGTAVAVALALKQTDETKFNRNVYNLSTATHARSAYNEMVVEDAVEDGFAHYKVVAPTNRIDDISPDGMTSKVLYKIFTLAALDKLINKMTDGKNANATTGLGLHHNSFIYLYPVQENELENEAVISSEQRKSVVGN